MQYLNAFLCGGLLCVIGQIFIDKTKLTPARIVVLYVCGGVLLTAIGVGGATVLGALIGFIFKGASHKFSDIVLSFASGVMPLTGEITPCRT